MPNKLVRRNPHSLVFLLCSEPHGAMWSAGPDDEQNESVVNLEDNDDA